jgi:hypothetical protein
LNKEGWTWTDYEDEIEDLRELHKKSKSFLTHTLKAKMAIPKQSILLFYENQNISTFRGKETEGPSLELIAIFTPSIKEIIVLTPESAKDFSKHAFIDFLDFCEQVGCKTVYMCVKRGTEDAKELIKGLMYVGFSLVSPTIKKIDNFVLLGTEL